MRLSEAVASAMHLLVIGFFFALAAFLFYLPSRPDWQLMGVTWLLDQPEQFYRLGAIAAAAFLLFLFGFFGIGRGRFLRLKMKPHSAMIDGKILKEAIEECFHTHFPRQVRGADVAIVSKERLDVVVDMVPTPESQQLAILREMDKQLCYLLRQRFGLKRPVNLSIHSK